MGKNSKKKVLEAMEEDLSLYMQAEIRPRDIYPTMTGHCALCGRHLSLATAQGHYRTGGCPAASKWEKTMKAAKKSRTKAPWSPIRFDPGWCQLDLSNSDRDEDDWTSTRSSVSKKTDGGDDDGDDDDVGDDDGDEDSTQKRESTEQAEDMLQHCCVCKARRVQR